MVKKYYFERIKGAWILEAINLRPVERNENEDFVEFFSHFAADSLFKAGVCRSLWLLSPQIRTMTSLFWRPLLI